MEEGGGGSRGKKGSAVQVHHFRRGLCLKGGEKEIRFLIDEAHSKKRNESGRED